MGVAISRAESTTVTVGSADAPSPWVGYADSAVSRPTTPLFPAMSYLHRWLSIRNSRYSPYSTQAVNYVTFVLGAASVATLFSYGVVFFSSSALSDQFELEFYFAPMLLIMAMVCAYWISKMLRFGTFAETESREVITTLRKWADKRMYSAAVLSVTFWLFYTVEVGAVKRELNVGSGCVLQQIVMGLAAMFGCMIAEMTLGWVVATNLIGTVASVASQNTGLTVATKRRLAFILGWCSLVRPTLVVFCAMCWQIVFSFFGVGVLGYVFCDYGGTSVLHPWIGPIQGFPNQCVFDSWRFTGLFSSVERGFTFFGLPMTLYVLLQAVGDVIDYFLLRTSLTRIVGNLTAAGEVPPAGGDATAAGDDLPSYNEAINMPASSPSTSSSALARQLSLSDSSVSWESKKRLARLLRKREMKEARKKNKAKLGAKAGKAKKRGPPKAKGTAKGTSSASSRSSYGASSYGATSSGSSGMAPPAYNIKL